MDNQYPNRFKNLKHGSNGRFWRVVNQADADVADVWIYDEIGLWGIAANDFVPELYGVNASSIIVHINSPGGDVFDGIAIYNALKDHQANVTTIVEGAAFSAASFIAMAGDEVVMKRNAEMMIHDAHGLCVGNAKDMTELATRLDAASDNIADIYVQKAGGTVDEWRDRMRETTWYSANEAKEAGLADRVDGGSESGTDNRWNVEFFNHSGRRDAPTPSPVTKSSEPESFEFDSEMIQRALKEAWK